MLCLSSFRTGLFKDAAVDPVIRSTHLNALETRQGAKLFEFAGHMPHTGCAVMRWTVDVPLVHKPSCADRKLIAAVCVSDFENRSRHRFALCHQQLQLSIDSLNH